MPSGSPRSHMLYFREKDEGSEATEGDLSREISGCLTERRHTWKQDS